jgi:cytochrome c oxidase cbb3-type subunit 3
MRYRSGGAGRWVSGVIAVGLLATAVPVWAQAPPARGTPPPSFGPRPQAGPPDRPPVDPTSADRGRTLYGVECITCHGSTARGTDRAPSLIRSIVVLNDRYGSLLGPFFKKGHPMQSGRPSVDLTESQAVDLMHFLRQRINDTLRGSPVFTVGDIVVGNPAAGKAYFDGVGGCTTCHSVTGDLAGLAARVPAPVDVQQRMLFPLRRPARGGEPTRTDVTVVMTDSSGATKTGILVQEDDFFLTYRDADGIVRVVRKTPSLKIDIRDPFRAHRELLDRITDANMHDLVAYLVTLR